MKRFKYLVSALVLMLVVTNLSFATQAQKDKIKQNNQEKQELRRQRNEKAKEFKELSSQIYSLDATIAEIEARMDNIQKQMKQININIKNIKTKITETENKIKQNEEMLGERIRAMYKTSDVTYFQLLLESKSIPDLVSNAYNVQKIVNADRNMLEELEQNRKNLEAEKTKLLAEKDRMTALQDQVKREQAEVEAHRTIQQKIKNQIAYDIHLIKLKEAELQRENNAIEQRILAAMRASGSSNVPYSGGTFIWPLSIRGTLTSGYGYRSDPFSGARSFHLGQDIAAPRGTPVLAVADGVVITSQYQNSYGNVVTIDHGGGISTVYAHNSALLVGEGARVVKGQNIALVGTTGNSTGNHLHFEVRINGRTTDPMAYFR